MLASMSLSEESSLVEGLVNEVLTSGKPLTGIQKEIIERLNETFVTEKLPELQKRHGSGQQLLNKHLAGFAHCDGDLVEKLQSVSTLNSEQSSLESAHTECVAEEGSLQGKQKMMQEELTAYLTAIQPPSSVMPEQPAPTPDLDNYIAQNLEFFESLQSSYALLKAQISAVEAEVDAKTAGCAEGRLIFDAKICLWKTEETLKTAHSYVEGRRADREALVKVQCYLAMLLDGSTTQEKMKACNDNAAGHTFSLDIVEPRVPDINRQLLDGLGAPGSQVRCSAAPATATTMQATTTATTHCAGYPWLLSL
ncbi:unnamed protein product [Polarella glacialis]|uniref:Uncharacterized protein n=1 Tax=Polarella glacialis TaxID=89957 RepID=A0A813GWD8_POLGL|nr:unnamed protein product [Polarella glacialis]